jgi:hypothetical protein
LGFESSSRFLAPFNLQVDECNPGALGRKALRNCKTNALRCTGDDGCFPRESARHNG